MSELTYIIYSCYNQHIYFMEHNRGVIVIVLSLLRTCYPHITILVIRTNRWQGVKALHNLTQLRTNSKDVILHFFIHQSLQVFDSWYECEFCYSGRRCTRQPETNIAAISIFTGLTSDCILVILHQHSFQQPQVPNDSIRENIFHDVLADFIFYICKLSEAKPLWIFGHRQSCKQVCLLVYQRIHGSCELMVLRVQTCFLTNKTENGCTLHQ
mmetsp:Transcript_15568/g.25945  ORF Transcript_15568/g.25945 Transcript_15568/m.25945 type:complete len:212 (+) Transcript_15568:498-1133(+)